MVMILDGQEDFTQEAKVGQDRCLEEESIKDLKDSTVL